MDILLFDQFTAEKSLEFCQREVEGAEPTNFHECYKVFVELMSRLLVAAPEKFTSATTTPRMVQP
jgi:hypothetical protein